MVVSSAFKMSLETDEDRWMTKPVRLNASHLNKLISSSGAYLLEVLLALLFPRNAVQSNIRGSMFPVDPETGLGHLREPEVFRCRDNICQNENELVIKMCAVNNPLT